MAKKTTSLKIDEELWKKVKIECIRNDIEISEYIEKLFIKDIKRERKKWN